MKPSELSAALRHIASKLDRSTNPSKEKVRYALQQVLAQVTAQEQQQGQQQEQAQQQQQALPKSGPGKQMVKEMLQKAMDAFEHDDHETFMKNIEKLAKTPAYGRV